uniref:Uncharacterized protein LOC104224715 n=1 Tax=Nicotiana sylvestris TaxID=4096 RepID=A0A1U7W3T7_NICSY
DGRPPLPPTEATKGRGRGRGQGRAARAAPVDPPVAPAQDHAPAAQIPAAHAQAPAGLQTPEAPPVHQVAPFQPVSLVQEVMVPVMSDDEQRHLERFSRLAPPPFCGAQGEDAQGFLDKCRRCCGQQGSWRLAVYPLLLFSSQWVPRSQREERRRQFEYLHQGDMTVSQYEVRFSELARYAPWMVPTNRERIRRFVDGLIYPIRILMARERILSHTFEDAVDIARDIEADRHQEREKREAKRPCGSGISAGSVFFGALPAQSSSHAPSVQGSSVPSASASHFGARGSHQFPYPTSGSCYERGEFGHMKRQCPRLRGSQSQQRGQSSSSAPFTSALTQSARGEDAVITDSRIASISLYAEIFLIQD